MTEAVPEGHKISVLRVDPAGDIPEEMRETPAARIAFATENWLPLRDEDMTGRRIVRVDYPSTYSAHRTAMVRWEIETAPDTPHVFVNYGGVDAVVDITEGSYVRLIRDAAAELHGLVPQLAQLMDLKNAEGETLDPLALAAGPRGAKVTAGDRLTLA